MSDMDSRGTIVGLGAALGYLGVMLLLAWNIVGLGAIFGGVSSPTYGIALGLGLLQFIVVTWGSGRVFLPARLERRLESPPEYDRI